MVGRRRCRGFDLVQLVTVVALIGVLAAVSFAVFSEPVEEVSRSYLRQTLLSVDMEVRQRVRETQAEGPGVWVGTVVGEDMSGDGCPSGGLIPVPVDECGLDEDPFVLVADVADDGAVPPTVRLERFGRCEMLTFDVDGGPGMIGPCEEFTP